MQLKSFNSFIREVIHEGKRLQRHDITGAEISKRRFTDSELICAFISVILLFLLPKGLTDNFAGYTISFLGIFIGLFSSIVISMYDKRASLIENYSEKSQKEKTQTVIVKNYLVQFTGLTSYAIFFAIVVILLLSLVLLFEPLKENIWNYSFIKNTAEISFNTIFKLIQVLFLLLHRFITLYYLLNFFMISLYSITSYFSFLQAQYKSINIKND